MHLVSAAVLERWNAVSDEQLVAHVLQGRTALFEIVMRRHNERLYRAIRALVADDCLAETLLQEAYVHAYANLRQFDGRTAFVIWLTRMAMKAMKPSPIGGSEEHVITE